MSIQNTVFWTALPKIRELTARAKELGMDSMAITDHGVMYGVIDFYRAAREVGIKPILGCEVYVAPGSRFDREKWCRRGPVLPPDPFGGKIIQAIKT